jgi:hypothetical protein
MQRKQGKHGGNYYWKNKKQKDEKTKKGEQHGTLPLFNGSSRIRFSHSLSLPQLHSAPLASSIALATQAMANIAQWVTY